MVAFIKTDLQFILDQIFISEAHASGADLNDIIPNVTLPWGLRTVDGTLNNLIPGNEEFGAANTEFPRLTTPDYVDGDFGTTYGVSGDLVDMDPRTISNLIGDQTTNNFAAVAAAEREGSLSIDHDNDPLTPDVFFIPNQAPDEGLSAPFNSWMTLFGQFFDHGLDLVNKGGSGTVFIPLAPDDPLYNPASPLNFMTLTRSSVDPGPDGLLGTADDGVGPTNDTTPWVDQNQTYTSHASHQVFLREYELNAAGEPVPTGRLIEGSTGGMANWGEVKAQAATLLGIELDDLDALDMPLLATDQYGNFIPGPNGFPQIVTAGPDGIPNTADDALIEGDPLSPVDASLAVRTGHTALADIAHFANPVDSAGAPLAPDADGVAGGPPPAAGFYDDELLDEHFIAGDGRANENIGLTAVHHVFHSEHNRLVEHTKTVLLETAQADGDLAFFNEWLKPDAQVALNADLTGLTIDDFDWNGSRLFQTAKFGTEMQYQHLVFEEFARKVQPLVNVFGSYDSTIDATIVGEFAHTVYRFGHSMLTETIDMLDADGNMTEIGLIAAFLNPLAFDDGNTVSADDAAGAIARGMTRQVGNEIDEFTTEALRNNLLGLPLDLGALNIARGRETGVPSLNKVREEFFAGTQDVKLKPYESWLDFALHLKHQESIVNFIAAYGTHSTITAETTLAGKRDAAMAIVLGGAGAPADRIDYLNSTGAWDGVETGLNLVDFWIGGLAEAIEPFGGMLGSTFNFVFEEQLERLQDGDRFYYLTRTAGLNFLTQLEQNSFAGMIMRNTSLDIDQDAAVSNAMHLPGDIFSTPHWILEMDQSRQVTNLDADGVTPLTGGNADPLDTESFLANVLPLVIRRDDDNDGDDDYLQYTGGDHVVLGGTNENDTLVGGIGDDTIWGDGGDDDIEGGDGGDILFGGDGDDVITDIGGINNIQGQDGNDAISAGAGEALILAGDGKDFVLAGIDLKETFGGGGDDFINAGDDANIVFGGEGSDWIEGGDGNDLLQGENGAPFQDDLNPGHDVFLGQGGDDDYDSEGGDDIMIGTNGINRMEGMAGFDWGSYQFDAFGIEVDMNLRAFNVVPIPPSNAAVLDRFDSVEGLSGSAFSDILRGEDSDAAILQTTLSELVNFDLIDGLRGSDNTFNLFEEDVTLFNGGNIILGGGGSDILEGRGGDDILDGDLFLNVRLSIHAAGTDTEIATTQEMQGMINIGGEDMTLAEAVFSRLVNPGDIHIVREILDGSSATDFDTAEFSDVLANYTVEGFGEDLDGDGFITVIHNDPNAGAGLGVDGTDRLRNIERLVFADQTIIVAGAEGLNQAPEGAPSIDDTTPGTGQTLTASIAGVTDPDNVSPTNPTGAISGTVAFTWQFEADPGTGVFEDIILEAIDAAGGNPVPVTGTTFEVTPDLLGLRLRVKATFKDDNGVIESVFSAPTELVRNLIVGTNGDDNLVGTLDSDEIDGLGGNDSIAGLAGDDFLLGRGGNDLLDGDGGIDNILGGGGDDTIIGGAGADILSGGSGNDTINGGGGADDINGGADDDIINGDGGADVIAGSSGNDTISGGGGNDVISGGGGNDVINGNNGADTINGNAGSDIINGGGGADILNGGGQADQLFGGGGADNLNGGGGADILDGGAGNDVYNTSQGNDVIVLSAGFGSDSVLGWDTNGGARDQLDISSFGLDAGDIGGAIQIQDNGLLGATITIGGDSIFLDGIAAADLDQDDFIFGP